MPLNTGNTKKTFASFFFSFSFLLDWKQKMGWEDYSSALSSSSGSVGGGGGGGGSTTDDDDNEFGFSHPGYIGVWYYLAVVYLAIEIYGIHKYFLSTDMYYSFLVQPQKVFYILIILGSFLRILFFVLQPLTIFGLPLSLSNTLNNFFLLLPNFLFFCAFFILLFLWIEAYYAARESPIQYLRTYFILTMVLMWSIFVVLLLCDVIYCRISTQPDVIAYCQKQIAEALTPCEGQLKTSLSLSLSLLSPLSLSLSLCLSLSLSSLSSLSLSSPSLP
jgi:hypothetical protein